MSKNLGAVISMRLSQGIKPMTSALFPDGRNLSNIARWRCYSGNVTSTGGRGRLLLHGFPRLRREIYFNMRPRCDLDLSHLGHLAAVFGPTGLDVIDVFPGRERRSLQFPDPA